MGATKAWWLAALDPRVHVCVDICCLTDYEELIRTLALSEHGVYYYVPSLLKHFQTAEINELIVPRPRLSVNGRRDPLTPALGVEKVRDHLLPLYRQYGNSFPIQQSSSTSPFLVRKDGSCRQKQGRSPSLQGAKQISGNQFIARVDEGSVYVLNRHIRILRRHLELSHARNYPVFERIFFRHLAGAEIESIDRPTFEPL